MCAQILKELFRQIYMVIWQPHRDLYGRAPTNWTCCFITSISIPSFCKHTHTYKFLYKFIYCQSQVFGRAYQRHLWPTCCWMILSIEDAQTTVWPVQLERPVPVSVPLDRGTVRAKLQRILIRFICSARLWRKVCIRDDIDNHIYRKHIFIGRKK
jgi:hypothetical protein